MRQPIKLALFTILTAISVSNAARADVLIKVNKGMQQLTVAVDGVQQYTWPVSTARAGYVTPNGEYRPVRLDRTWFSRKYHNSPMPYSIFFHGGYAIHGSFEHAEIGRPASHGCVRLDPKNAEVLFNLVEEQGPDKTRITIDGPGPSSFMEAHLKDAPHRPKMTAERRPQMLARSGKMTEHGAHTAYVRKPSLTRSYSEGSPPLVDPFSELISYVRNHDD